MGILVRRPGLSRPVVVVVACVAVLTLGSGTANAKTVSASKWVTAVCAAETKLHSAVQTKFDALNAASSAGDVAATKAALVGVVAALVAPTKTLLSSLNNSGVPKITNGTKIAQTYVSTVQSLAKQLPDFKSKLAALPTTDMATFMNAANAVLTPLMHVTQAADKKVQTLDKDGTVATPLGRCGGVFAAGGGRSGNSAPSTTTPGGGTGQGAGTPATSAPAGGTGGGSGGGAPASVRSST